MQINAQTVLLIYAVAAIKIYYRRYIIWNHCSGSNLLKLKKKKYFIISPVNLVPTTIAYSMGDAVFNQIFMHRCN